jgi:hypothetical protein
LIPYRLPNALREILTFGGIRLIGIQFGIYYSNIIEYLDYEYFEKATEYLILAEHQGEITFIKLNEGNNPSVYFGDTIDLQENSYEQINSSLSEYFLSTLSHHLATVEDNLSNNSTLEQRLNLLKIKLLDIDEKLRFLWEKHNTTKIDLVWDEYHKALYETYNIYYLGLRHIDESYCFSNQVNTLQQLSIQYPLAKGLWYLGKEIEQAYIDLTDITETIY